MQRWGKWEKDKYPCCGLLEESLKLVYCKGLGVTDFWLRFLKSLLEWMVAVQTNPDIACIIINGLKNWRDRSYLPLSNLSYISVAVQQQEDTGW